MEGKGTPTRGRQGRRGLQTDRVPPTRNSPSPLGDGCQTQNAFPSGSSNPTPPQTHMLPYYKILFSLRTA